MSQRISRSFIYELINSQMLGQKRREDEFLSITRELLEYYLNRIGVSNKEAIVQDSLSWISENMMTLEDKQEFIPWVVQIATINALGENRKDFLQDAMRNADNSGVSYPYTRVDQDTECFIPKKMIMPRAIELAETIFKEENQDLKFLGALFFIGQMSIQQIAEVTEGKISLIALGTDYIKSLLVEKVANSQRTPEGEYESLSDKNWILVGFEEGFYKAYNQKYAVDTEAERKRGPVLPNRRKVEDTVEEKNDINDSNVRFNIEPEAAKPLASENIVKNTERPAPVQITKSVELLHEDNKKNTKKKSKYYVGIAMASVAVIVLLGTFVIKLISVFNNKSDKQPEQEIVQELQNGDINNQKEEELNEQQVRLGEAYINQVGTVSIVLSGTINNAPKEVKDDQYYFYGSTYDFDLKYEFIDDDETALSDKPEIALQYTDITEHLSQNSYQSRKETIDEDDLELMTFDDENHKITKYTDWQETYLHTAYDYEKDDCVTTWLSVLDSCRNAIETMGDGCDLLPLMSDNLTTTVNGKTYQLVFYSANGYYIKDDDTNEDEGSSINNTIVCEAYLETF